MANVIKTSQALPASALSVQDNRFFTQARTRPRRDPAAALRWFAFFDVVALLGAWGLAFLAAVGINNLLLGRDFRLTSDLLNMTSPLVNFALVGAGVIFWFMHRGHYRQRMPFWLEARKILTTFFFAVLAGGFLEFASKADSSRLWMLLAWVFAAFGTIALRSIARALLLRAGQWSVRTVLVGSGALADEAFDALRAEPELGYDVVAQIEDLKSILEAFDHSWQKLCDRFNADYVVVALDAVELAQMETEISDLARSSVPFSVAPPLHNLPVLGTAVHYVFSHDIIFMAPVNNLAQPFPRFLKRSMDIAGSSLALLMLAPVFLTVAFFVRLDGGSALYGHGRIGRGGRPFQCLKFRSMVLNGDEVLQAYLAKNSAAREEWDTMRKLKDDPRVTKIGQFIRNWSIDELPQLINVLRGDMSLVGPRPVVTDEVLAYKEDAVYYTRVRPGLTGLWQISGRSDVSFTRRVQMDSWYVRNWSLWHDIVIVLKTFPVILKKTGAY
ncbi:MAG: undecaprenyl-phosphate galactose phosphotransferase WbaP [Alphaproteobacteria bacterium]|nr:undecaprenyl-phosphate galactose phosphotransferase WbaP [Alphaproteobacteria bacterium]